MNVNRLNDEVYLKTTKFLENILEKHQKEANRDVFLKERNIGFSVNNENNTLGAVLCHQIDASLHINMLAVTEEARGQGVGRLLMSCVDDFAKEQHCIRITLTTLDFQACDFYKKCGYTIFAELEDTPIAGTTKYYMTKRM